MHINHNSGRWSWFSHIFPDGYPSDPLMEVRSIFNGHMIKIDSQQHTPFLFNGCRLRAISRQNGSSIRVLQDSDFNKGLKLMISSSANISDIFMTLTNIRTNQIFQGEIEPVETSSSYYQVGFFQLPEGEYTIVFGRRMADRPRVRPKF